MTVRCTHKNPDSEEDSCPIVDSKIVNDWLSSLPKERSQPVVNPSEITTGLVSILPASGIK